MDTQTQLDLQFGLEPIVESIEEPSQNTNVGDSDGNPLHDHARKGQRHVSNSDEATTSAMNNLALKPVPKTGKQIPKKSSDGGSTVSSERISLPEAHATRLRKRKSQESPDPDIPAKRISPTKTRPNREPTPVTSKPAIGQLTRPSDPLNAKKLHSSGRSVPMGDKFDVLSQQNPKMPSRKIEQLQEQGKKPRGRPRKEIAVIARDAVIFDEIPPPAAVPKASRSSRRLNPDLEGLGSNVGKKTTSGVLKTQNRGTIQASKSLSPDSVFHEDKDNSVIHEDKDDEVSDNEHNHSETPRARSDLGGESEAVDPNTLQESDDSDEGDQSSEDEDIASDSEDEDEPAFELFGGTWYWDQVIEGARTVGASRLRDNVVSKRPKITTGTGQDLVTLIQDVESFYKGTSSSTGSAADTETVEHNLQSLLENLEEMIDGLSESNGPEDDRLKSLLIQDVYAHAIPAMVFMFRAALRCRTERYSEPNDTETLKEIVWIQELIIRLCVKARRWKAVPLTKRPIMGPIANKILPCMRDLKERCFGREFYSRENFAKQKYDEQRFLESHKKMQEQKELEKQKHAQKVLDQRRKIYQRFQSKPKGIGSRSQQSTPLKDAPQFHKRSHSNASTQWTTKQNVDLVDGLRDAKTRHLPAQERYLAILNTPSLQNKLPEHIRDRALAYKALMIENFGPEDWFMSIE